MPCSVYRCVYATEGGRERERERERTSDSTVTFQRAMLKESPKVSLSLAKNPKFSSDKTPVGVDRIATQVVEVDEERRKQYQGNESTDSLPRTQSATQKLGFQ